MRMSKELVTLAYEKWDDMLLRLPKLHGWTLSIGETHRNTMGECSYKKMVITLSNRILTEELLIDTIIHEICHVLAPGDGHGKLWKSWCRRLGCIPRAKQNVGTEFYQEKLPDPKWTILFKKGNYEFEEVGTARRKLKCMDARYVADRKTETIGKLWLIDTKIWKEKKEFPVIIRDSLVR